MVSETRARKIANRIGEELATILHQKVADPRLDMVTVTGVDVDRELAYATVYVSAIDSRDRKGEISAALAGAQRFLRRELAQRIPMRAFPQLRFRWDPAPDRGARIDELLAGLNREQEGGGSEIGAS